MIDCLVGGKINETRLLLNFVMHTQSSKCSQSCRSVEVQAAYVEVAIELQFCSLSFFFFQQFFVGKIKKQKRFEAAFYKDAGVHARLHKGNEVCPSLRLITESSIIVKLAPCGCSEPAR